MEIKIKDININYEIIGDGKPILLIHGYYPDHRLMLGCMENVFENRLGFKRIYIDLPGMGKSQSQEWIKNSDIMLDIVIDFINMVIPNENFLLAGESYGGYLSRGLIYKMPERIDGLMLLCPCIIADNTKRRLPSHVVLQKDEELLSQLDPSDAEEFSSMLVIQTKENWEKYRDNVLCGVKIANDVFLRHFRKTGYGFSFDVDKLNTKYEKPTLMLLGRQDASVGYKDAFDILDNYPRATFCVLDSAGHVLEIEQESLFTSLVNEWLDRLKCAY